jgi:dihydrodipicolinate synthase/N-acetylneuraminate lyase
MEAHLNHLAPWVQGYLIPGSTGDGWELTDRESEQVLELALNQAGALGCHLLIGVLKRTGSEAQTSLHRISKRLRARTGTDTDDMNVCLEKARVCGFTVCPPTGKGLTQEEMAGALAPLLESGVPIALYQLPQITGNEMSPELVAEFGGRYENFLFFKDSSGGDRVANSGTGAAISEVFLVRGAEGDYARWFKAGGGPYDGFLLSTANCLAEPLHNLIVHLNAKRLSEANVLSDKLTDLVQEAFRLIGTVRDGNAFANANKAMDHFFAYGPKAASVAPPRLHAGSQLPAEVIRATGALLDRFGMMPKKGYLE